MKSGMTFAGALLLALAGGPLALAGARPKNTSPSVQITAPADGSVFSAGAPVTFTGIASDKEDGDLTAVIAWTSSLDQAIGTGGSFTISTLSAGAHSITASVVDSGGKSASDTIGITIQSVLAIDAVDMVAPADPDAAARYGKVELLVALSGAAGANPFEPDPDLGGVDLHATFTSPTGSDWPVNGFYDGAAWRIRFAPGELGAWTFTVAVSVAGQSASWGTDPEPPGTFTCVDSSHPGWPRIQGRYLKFTGGKVVYAVGHNTGWQDGPEGVELPALTEMASRGENLLSFWLATPWDQPSWGEERAARSPIENSEGGLGNYNQSACAYLDGVVARAEAAGVCLLPTIWAHAQLRAATGHPWGPGNWDNNAYNAVCSAAAFFDMGSSDQWRYQQNFYRYLIARWGHSRAIAGWVALCEADGTSAYISNPSQIDAWSAAVAGYFRANDAFRGAGSLYALTSSKSDYAAGAATWDPGVDLRAEDSYTSEGNDVAVAGTIATQTLAMGSGGEPCVHTEFGGNEMSGATQPAHLHNGIWGGASAGAAISPLLWCDGGNFPMLDGAMQRHLEIQAEFMASIDYLTLDLSSGALTTSAGCQGWVTRAGDRGFAWVQATTTGGTIDGASVTVPGVAHGSYTVRFYNVWTDGSSPTASVTGVTVNAETPLTVLCPDLGTPDVAIKFAPDSTPPTNAPLARDDAYDAIEDDLLVVPVDTGVLANDEDADGDGLTVSVQREPANGTVSLAEDGSFLYAPDAGFSGEDEFAYTAGDGTFDSLVAVVTVTVTGVNEAPTAADDTATTDQDVAVLIPVLENDSDPDPGDTLSVIAVTQGDWGGAVAINPDSTVTYTPAPGFFGQDTFTYTISDAAGATDTANVTVTILEVVPVIPSISGAITSGSSGLAGIEVLLERPLNKRKWTTVGTTLTNDEGVYGFEDLAAGTYRVTPVTEGYSYDPESQTVELAGPDDHVYCDFEAY